MRWGYVAAAWAALFAVVHLYWAFGGSLGLAESAGADLARERPIWFVVLGLYGVAALLALAGLLGWALGLGLAARRRSRALPLLGTGVAAILLVRAVAVEVLLLAVPGYGNGAVSESERFWTLVLWNPWFFVGGVAFGLAALAARRSVVGMTT